MQRAFLLFLSISLGVLVFLCSQRDFRLPILAKNSTQIQLTSFQPFYYAALKVTAFDIEQENGIAQFLEEFEKQNLAVSDPLLIFKTNLEKTQKAGWIIASKVPESLSISSPLYKAKWNWGNILIWEGANKDTLRLDSEKLLRFLKDQHLFAIGPIIEIFESSDNERRKFWLPVQKEVGN
jgi:hypothetical protein